MPTTLWRELVPSPSSRHLRTFVAEQPPLNNLSARTALLDDLARRTIAAAKARGIDAIDVAQRIRDIEEQREDHR